MHWISSTLNSTQETCLNIHIQNQVNLQLSQELPITETRSIVKAKLNSWTSKSHLPRRHRARIHSHYRNRLMKRSSTEPNLQKSHRSDESNELLVHPHTVNHWHAVDNEPIYRIGKCRALEIGRRNAEIWSKQFNRNCKKTKAGVSG